MITSAAAFNASQVRISISAFLSGKHRYTSFVNALSAWHETRAEVFPTQRELVLSRYPIHTSYSSQKETLTIPWATHGNWENPYSKETRDYTLCKLLVTPKQIGKLSNKLVHNCLQCKESVRFILRSVSFCQKYTTEVHLSLRVF